jgi:hypothetical protein
LALGIGPNVAIFSIIWATFLAPPPYPNANELVVVWRHFKGDRIPTGGEEYAELAVESHSFQSLSFLSWLPVHLTNADHTADQEAGLPATPGLQTRTVLPHPAKFGGETANLFTASVIQIRQQANNLVRQLTAPRPIQTES